MAAARQAQVEAVPGLGEGLVAEGVKLLRDVVSHDQSEDLGDVAVLGEEQVELLPPPGHVPAGVVGPQGHLWGVEHDEAGDDGIQPGVRV